MPKYVQQVRHNTASADAFTGLEGVVSVDTTAKELRVHDGLTAGGIATARKDLANVAAATASVAGKMSAADKVELASLRSDLTTDEAALVSEIANRIADVDAEEARALAAEGVLETDLDAVEAFFPAAGGTAEASKILVLGTSKDIDTIDVTTLLLGGSTITVSAAAINDLVRKATTQTISGDKTFSGAITFSGTVSGAAPAFRGCLISKDSDDSARADGVSAVISFDTAVYDTDSIFDAVTDDTVLVVPAGVTKVRIKAMGYATVNALNEDGFFSGIILKNGTSGYAGLAYQLLRYGAGSNGAASQRILLETPVLEVTAGDEFSYQHLSDNTGYTWTMRGNANGAETWIAMEIIE